LAWLIERVVLGMAVGERKSPLSFSYARCVAEAPASSQGQEGNLGRNYVMLSTRGRARAHVERVYWY
jgi:hypothetical protein